MKYTLQNILLKIRNTINKGFDYIKINSPFVFLKTSLDLRTHVSNNSCYNDFPLILSNGQTLTIRLADHPAVESNFKTDIAISIIVQQNNFFVIQYDTSQIYEEIFYSSECFNEQNIKQALTEILQGFEYALENNGRFKKGELGEYIIQREMKNTEQKRFRLCYF